MYTLLLNIHTDATNLIFIVCYSLHGRNAVFLTGTIDAVSI